MTGEVARVVALAQFVFGLLCREAAVDLDAPWREV